MKEKLFVSFSGGKTSGYMTKHIIDNYSDEYELVVMFLFSFSLYLILFMKNKIAKNYSIFILISYIIFIISLFLV